MTFFDIVVNFRKILWDGLSVTIMLGIVMLVGGTILGSIYAGILATKSNHKAVRIAKKIVHVMVEIFRGAPLLTLLFFGFYGLSYLGFQLNDYTSSLLIRYSE